MVQYDNPLELKVPVFQPDHVDLRQYSVFKHSKVTVNIKASRTWSSSSMSKYAVDPRSELCFLDPKKMNFRRDSHFHQGEVFKCVCV